MSRTQLTPIKHCSLTADPTATEADTWWRSDTDQLSVKSSSNVIRVGTYTHPHIVTGQDYWYCTPTDGSNSTIAWTDGRLCVALWVPGRSCTINGLAMEIVAAATTAGNYRMVIYGTGSDGLPGALLLDTGAQAASAGVKTRLAPANFTAVNVEPIPYWIGAVVQGSSGGSPTWRCRASQQSAFIPEINGTPVLNANQTHIAVSGVTGAAPDPFGTPSNMAQGPSVKVRID